MKNTALQIARKVLAIKRGAEQMASKRKALPYRPKARQEVLRAFG